MAQSYHTMRFWPEATSCRKVGPSDSELSVHGSLYLSGSGRLTECHNGFEAFIARWLVS